MLTPEQNEALAQIIAATADWQGRRLRSFGLARILAEETGLTSAQVCAALGVSHATYYRRLADLDTHLIRAGVLPAAEPVTVPAAPAERSAQ